MDKLSDLIPKVLTQKGVKDQADASYAIYLAVDWLHSQSVELAEQCIVSAGQDHEIIIECRSAEALKEMEQKSEDLKAHLSSFEGICITNISTTRSKTA